MQKITILSQRLVCQSSSWATLIKLSLMLSPIFVFAGCTNVGKSNPSSSTSANVNHPNQQATATTATTATTVTITPIRFAILHKGRIGYMDETGREVINAQFDAANSFKEGFGPVLKGKKWGYVDPQGKVVIPYQFDDAQPFSEGLAPFEMKQKWGYIDTLGHFKINPQFEAVKPFSESLAAVKLAGRWGFIDTSGKLVINPQFQYNDAAQEASATLSFSDGLCGVPETSGEQDDSDERYGYIGKDGKWVISPQFDFVLDFKQGLGAVETGEHWGFINKQGTFAINPQFDSAQSFASDRACVKLGDRYGYIDLTGKYVVNPQYDMAYSFTDGLAAVKSGNRWGYIDPSGQYVINPQFDDANSFQDGLAVVQLNNRLGYIDHTGRFVWGPATAESLIKTIKPKPKIAEVAVSQQAVPQQAAVRPTYVPTYNYPFTGPNIDPLTAWAPAGSGLSDAPFSTYDMGHSLVTDSDLAGKSLRALSITYNEIYARHGYSFKRPSLQVYFGNQPWYRINPYFSERDLNNTERYNLKVIRAFERSHFGF